MKQCMLAGLACVFWSLAAQSQTPEPVAPSAEENKPAEESKPAEDLSATAGPRVNTSSAEQSAVGGNAPANNKPAGNQQPVGPDQLQLDTTIVTGNRELPKVLYIVPWKKAEIGELPSQPFNSLLDEALQPVDRDVFRREVSYFGVVNNPFLTPPGGAAAEPQAAPAQK